MAAMYNRAFKLCTTSFIFPDHIIPNVEKLAPYFDEIELLIFESRPREVLPSKKEINTLLSLSRQHDLTYNIHLPVDVSLSQGSNMEQERAKETLVEVMALFKPLHPTTHTLHLEMPEKILSGLKDKDLQDKGHHGRHVNGNDQFAKWKNRVHENLADFLDRTENPSGVSIETLNYPFDLVKTFVADFNLSVCADIGHGIKYGHDWMNTCQTHLSRLPVVHVHGVDFSSSALKDHTSLDVLPGDRLCPILDFLTTYSGVVSLEVFNYENLVRSLAVLSRFFKNIPISEIKCLKNGERGRG